MRNDSGSQTRNLWIAAVLALLLATVTASTVGAHKYSSTYRYLWDTSVTPQVWDMNTDYLAQIQDAANDFDDNTVLTVELPCNGTCGGNIRYYQASYGATGWRGLANPYTDGDTCVTFSTAALNGECDETANQADFAYLYYNSYYDLDEDKWYRATHELGHAFGLAHNASPSSVMNTSVNAGSLTTHDKDDIDDDLYP